MQFLRRYVRILERSDRYDALTFRVLTAASALSERAGRDFAGGAT